MYVDTVIKILMSHLKVCQGWQKRELIRLVTDLQLTESYPLYLIVLFRRKQSNHPDFVGIAPILHDEANMR